MIRYETPTAAIDQIKALGAVAAIRGGACGPNNKLRRNSWDLYTTSGTRTATAPEARKLNAIGSAATGYGAVLWETQPGLIEGLGL